MVNGLTSDLTAGRVKIRLAASRSGLPHQNAIPGSLERFCAGLNGDLDTVAHSARGSRLLVSLLDEITNHGAEIRTRLRELLPREAAGDNKTDWLIGSMDIALEHHEAVERLIKSNLNGSAFGVVRMVFDTFLRAAWLAAYATDARMKQAAQDKLEWPNMEKMRNEIKQAYFEPPSEPEAAVSHAALFEFLKKSWRIMCDYTHSGSRQIARRFKDNELKPNYSDGAIAEAVHLTNFAVLLMTGMVFCAMGQMEKVEESASMLADYTNEKFGERLRATNSVRANSIQLTDSPNERI